MFYSDSKSETQIIRDTEGMLMIKVNRMNVLHSHAVEVQRQHKELLYCLKKKKVNHVFLM